MREFNLNLESEIKGIYLSTETIDLMSIIQCSNIEELKEFVSNCEQLNKEDIDLSLSSKQDFEETKRNIFNRYKESFLTLEESTIDRERVLEKILSHSGIPNEKMYEYVEQFKRQGTKAIRELAEKDTENYAEFAKAQHRYMASERDQIKDVSYEEIETLAHKLSEYNTVLLGSGKYQDVVNRMYVNTRSDVPKCDFYHIQRGIDFCVKNGKQVRYHTLLDKQNLDNHIAGSSREEVLSNLSEYVRNSIDYINENKCVKDKSGKEVQVIKSIDLFNEIISFDPPYENRWEKEYGINLEDIANVFDYAVKNKPEGVTYLYNEPFLENEERRKVVIETFKEIKKLSPNLLDSLGTQMHITTEQNLEAIGAEFEDLKKLQDSGVNIQITEFDMCLPETKLFDEAGKVKAIEESEIQEKEHKIKEITSIIRASGVKLEGLSYWTATDTLSPDVERTNKNTFIAKDFYEKYKKVSHSEKTEDGIKSLKTHPFLSEDLAERIESVYKQEGGKEKIEKAIRSKQRNIIKSRLSGVYSELGKEKEINKQRNNDVLASGVKATEMMTRTRRNKISISRSRECL